MDRDAYEEHLVDKAKDMLREAAADVEDDNKRKRRIATEEIEESVTDVDTAEKKVGQMRNEAEFLSDRRNSMDNDELEEFLSGESEFHELMKDAEKPDSTNSERSLDRKKSSISSSFSDWENRVLITSPNTNPEELAEELDRSVDAIKLQLKVLGLDR